MTHRPYGLQVLDALRCVSAAFRPTALRGADELVTHPVTRRNRSSIPVTRLGRGFGKLGHGKGVQEVETLRGPRTGCDFGGDGRRRSQL